MSLISLPNSREDCTESFAPLWIRSSIHTFGYLEAGPVGSNVEFTTFHLISGVFHSTHCGKQKTFRVRMAKPCHKSVNCRPKFLIMWILTPLWIDRHNG